MKNLCFFLVLLFTFSILYLVCKEYTEEFTIPGEKKSIADQELAQQLKIDLGRIRNFKEFGDPSNEQQYKISFEIHPKSIAQPNQPLVTEIEEALRRRQDEKQFFKVTTPLGQDVFLSQIQVKSKDIINQEKEAEQEGQFINPAYRGSIEYLKDKERGIRKDRELERGYRFEKGELVLEPKPSISPAPTSTPIPSTSAISDEVTVPTMSFIE